MFSVKTDRVESQFTVFQGNRELIAVIGSFFLSFSAISLFPFSFVPLTS